CWYEEGSNFRNQLAAQNIECRTFKWSGNNSILARRRAATKLRQILHRARKEEPDTCHLVLAHSHGGNVAVRALGQSKRAHPLADGIVTMGTPFFHVSKRTTNTPERYLIFWVQLAFLLYLPFTISSVAITQRMGELWIFHCLLIIFFLSP